MGNGCCVAMPQFDLEARTRDLPDLLAQRSISEDPPPSEVDIALPRLVGDSDTLTLTEDYDSLAGAGGPYKVVPKNLLANPVLADGLTDWTVTTASAHTVSSSQVSTDPLLQAAVQTALQLELTGSTGSGNTTITQAVDEGIVGGDTASFEAWVRLEGLVGSASVRMLVRALDMNGVQQGVSSIATRSSASTDWVLLKTEGYDLPAVGHFITVTWTEPGDGGSVILRYDVRFRETGTAAWTTHDAGGAMSYTIGGLDAATQYDVQVRAVNANGEGDWSSTVTETTGS